MSESIESISTDDTTRHEKDSTTTPRRWPVLVLLQLAYLVVLAALHLIQPDWSAAIIVIPIWCWTVPALSILAIHIGFQRRRIQAVLLVGWLIMNGIFFDSALSLYREYVLDSPNIVTNSKANQSSIRIISLNCKDRLSEIENLKQYQPDVVLLQEAPGELDIMAARKTLFGDEGDYIWNHDCSIIVRGKILETFKGLRHTHALVSLDTVPFDFRVVSMRLDRPEVRFDLWNIECWTRQSFCRRKQRRQIRQVLESLDYTLEKVPTIIGGDFNSLHGNNLLNAVEKNYSDAHLTSGYGWGKTFPNQFPILRLDRIVFDKHWQAEFMVTVPSGKSDHRILICDLVPIDSN